MAMLQRNKAGREFEVDHRVPLCIGGADDQRICGRSLAFNTRVSMTRTALKPASAERSAERGL